MRSLRRLFGQARTRSPFRDPAPTRWAYRYQRWMLTPAFRRFVHVGVPILCVAAIAASWFSQDANRARFTGAVDEIKVSFQHRPEFMVDRMEITGANISVAAAVQALVTHDFPVSSWDMDLPRLQDRVTELAAVEHAVVRIRGGGVLEIAVDERAPVAIWRHTDGLRLIDANGEMIAIINARADRADLPLIVGEGAMAQMNEAMALFATARPVADRVRGLARIGARRWDLVLDRGQRIMLPEADAAGALQRVMALHQGQDLMERDIVAVDMRNPARPTVRMGAMAVMGLYPAGDIE